MTTQSPQGPRGTSRKAAPEAQLLLFEAAGHWLMPAIRRFFTALRPLTRPGGWGLAAADAILSRFVATPAPTQ